MCRISDDVRVFIWNLVRDKVGTTGQIWNEIELSSLHSLDFILCIHLACVIWGTYPYDIK